MVKGSYGPQTTVILSLLMVFGITESSTIAQALTTSDVQVNSVQTVRSENSVNVQMNNTVTTNGVTVMNENDVYSNTTSSKTTNSNGTNESNVSVTVKGDAEPTIIINNEVVTLNATENAQMPEIERVEYEHKEMGVFEYVIFSIRNFFEQLF